MFPHQKLTKLCWAWTGVSLVCLSAAACAPQQLNLRGDNFNDDYSQWGENNRPADESASAYGFSRKAQQIERNVGVR